MSVVLRRCACVLVVLASAVAGLALTAAPASAAPAPWFIGDPNTVGGWFTFGGTVTSGDTVTLQRNVSPSGTDPASVFASEASGGGDLWPSSGDAGGFHFERTTACSFSSPSCAYVITGPEESGVVFGSGTPPGGPGTAFPTAGGVTTPTTQPPTTQPPTTVPNPGQVVGKATFVPGSGGAGDSASFDATGSSAPGGAPITGYTWKLQPHNASNPSLTIPCATEICPLPSGMKLERGETYDVTLSLTYAGGTLDSPSAQPFAIPAPDPPSNPNPGGGTPSGGGGGGGAPSGGGGGGGSGAGVFARPVSRVPSELTGGFGASAPTIVWLWRPDFYQGQTLPQTGGVPELKGKANIIVATDYQPSGASAGPWLAGLALFAIVFGWFLVRRRLRLRHDGV